jgi:hypothetical protein
LGGLVGELLKVFPCFWAFFVFCFHSAL